MCSWPTTPPCATASAPSPPPGRAAAGARRPEPRISARSAPGAPTPPCTSGAPQRPPRPPRSRAATSAKLSADVHTDSEESETMKAQLLTMSTPDGPFTIIARDGAVLASGWTAVPGELTGPDPSGPAARTSSRPLPELGAISDAVDAFYAGDPAPAMARAGAAEVRAVPQPRLGRAPDRRAGTPGDLHRIRGTVRERESRPRRGQCLCLQRCGPVRALPPRGPDRRHPGRLPLGAGRQGKPAGPGTRARCSDRARGLHWPMLRAGQARCHPA